MLQLLDQVDVLALDRESEANRRKSSERSASEMLQSVNQERQALARAKERFFEVVSHELRTPLAGIMASTEILRDGMPEDDPNSEWVEIAHESTHRLMRTVARIEEMVWLSSQSEAAGFEVVPLSTIIDELRVRIDQTIVSKDVSCELEWPEVEVGLATSFDFFVRLCELLIENALRFTEENTSVKARMSVALGTGNKDRLVVEVLDQGPGVPVEEVRTIFDSFYQAPIGNDCKPAGMGLGLSICSLLAGNLGTRIDVRHRTDNSGMCFSFELPCLFRNHAERDEAWNSKAQHEVLAVEKASDLVNC